MIQELTVEDAMLAARKAYAEGRLTAQHPEPSERACVYKRGNFGCAIGVGLTPETHLLIQKNGAANGRRVSGLEEMKIVSWPDAETGKQLRAIQDAHDEWAQLSRGCGLADAAQIAKAKQDFLETIGVAEDSVR